jgi:F-type H+-transporting ATPase subunit a
MVEAGAKSAVPELPNLVTLVAGQIKDSHFASRLVAWENVIFSALIIVALAVITRSASRGIGMIPGRMQSFFEMVVGGIDDFVCGIIGHKGRQFVPFIGTLFIFILCMNLSGLIPLIKSPTTNWSITLALAICVIVYVLFTGVKELGLRGYLDHALGKPRGIVAFSIFIPILMFFLHIVSDLLVRPISLSLRLRSNIWGDDMLLAVFAGYGLAGVPLLLFNTFMAIIVSLVQALVFALLTTIYFTLILSHDE